MKKISGTAFVINIYRSEEHAIELENIRNGRIKYKLLQDIESAITHNFQQYRHLVNDIMFFKRSSGLIVFLEANKYKSNDLDTLINYLLQISKSIVNKYNHHYQKDDLFKASYGVEFSHDNVLFDFQGSDEILGKSISVASKIANHKSNPQSLFVGQDASKYTSVSSAEHFNVIKGMVYQAYKFLPNSNTMNEFRSHYKYDYKYMSMPVGISQEKNDGAVYIAVDIKNSTKALFQYDILSIASKQLNVLIEIYNAFNAIGTKAEFRGDGFLFWKHNVDDHNKIQEVFNLINKICNSDEYKKRITTEGLHKLINTKLDNIKIGRVLKLKIGADVSKKYSFFNSYEPSISPHKVIAEISEGYATKDRPIICGESFLSRLYMNDSDYCNVVHVIKNYRLLSLYNSYLFKSENVYRRALNNKIMKKIPFLKHIDIDFSSFYDPDKPTYVKNFGKEARNANSAEKRRGRPTESTLYNGLHFYISKDNEYLQIFINDGRGRYIQYGSN